MKMILKGYSMDKLGENMQLVALPLRGDITQSLCLSLTKTITKKIGVKMVKGKSICIYPVGGKGGYGFTYFQPFTESFLAWDIWSNLNGAYLVICSCKPFWISSVVKVLRSAGLTVLRPLSGGMSFDDTEL